MSGQVSTTVRVMGEVIINADGLQLDASGNPMHLGSGEPTGAMLYVSKTGNDSTGKRGDADKPFLTLTAAKTAATVGDTIIVYPGIYLENNLLKDGVSWYFHGGATVTYVDPGTGAGRGIFDDRVGAITCTISGEGNFNYKSCLETSIEVVPGSGGAAFTGTNANTLGLFVIQNSGSNVTFRARKLGATGFNANTAAAICACYIKNCTKVVLDIDEIYDPLDGFTVDLEDSEDPGTPITIVAQTIGVYWEKGECYTNIRKILMSNYCLYGLEPIGAPDTNWYINCDYIKSSGAAAYYNAGQGGNPLWRTWANIKEIISGGLGCSFLTGGNHYLNCQKITNTAANTVFGFGGGDLNCWVNIQKITSTTAAAALGVTASFTGTAFLNIEHIENTSTGVGFDIASNTGKVYLTGHLIKTANAKGITYAGGTVKIVGMSIDTSATNSSGNNPISVSASLLILSGCSLVSGATANSITAAAAKNVAVHSQCVATVAKHANVTITVGTLTVDTAVIA